MSKNFTLVGKNDVCSILPDKSEHSNQGYVYVIEYGDRVKIGYTKNPRERLAALKRMAAYNNTPLGRSVWSPLCSNYKEIEKHLHSVYETSRVDGTELFRESLNDVWGAMNNLEYRLEYVSKGDCREIFKSLVEGAIIYHGGKMVEVKDIPDKSSIHTDDEIFNAMVKMAYDGYYIPTPNERQRFLEQFAMLRTAWNQPQNVV